MHTEAVQFKHLSKQLGCVHDDIQFVSVDWPVNWPQAVPATQRCLSMHNRYSPPNPRPLEY